MKKSPVALVRERFQSKEKLVEAVQKLATEDLWLDRVSSEKGLSRVSNQKLLKLHDKLTDAKQRFGSRDKLIDAILELKKRTKDAGYTARLKQYAVPELLDLHSSVERANKRAVQKAAPKGKRFTKPAEAPKAAAATTKKETTKKAPAAAGKKAPAAAAKKAPAKRGK
jgi:hypothetical protein